MLQPRSFFRRPQTQAQPQPQQIAVELAAPDGTFADDTPADTADRREREGAELECPTDGPMPNDAARLAGPKPVKKPAAKKPPPRVSEIEANKVIETITGYAAKAFEQATTEAAAKPEPSQSAAEAAWEVISTQAAEQAPAMTLAQKRARMAVFAAKQKEARREEEVTSLAVSAGLVEPHGPTNYDPEASEAVGITPPPIKNEKIIASEHPGGLFASLAPEAVNDAADELALSRAAKVFIDGALGRKKAGQEEKRAAMLELGRVALAAERQPLSVLLRVVLSSDGTDVIDVQVIQ